MTYSDELHAAPYILFRIADTHWGVSASVIERIHDHLTIQIVPGTRRWFLGLTQVDGQLLPVTDMSAWLGGAAANGGILQIQAEIGLCGLRVDEVLGADHSEAKKCPLEQGSPALIPGAMELCVERDNDRFRLINVRMLVQSPAFMAIREVAPA